jgi:hypothetical protein
MNEKSDSLQNKDKVNRDKHSSKYIRNNEKKNFHTFCYRLCLILGKMINIICIKFLKIRYSSANLYYNSVFQHSLYTLISILNATLFSIK